MQYFVQAFGARQAFPRHYDLLMDIATEEFSHLEIVGATITMLLDGLNGELEDAAENVDVVNCRSESREAGDDPPGDDEPAVFRAHRRRTPR
jgi:Mn-containing catalase